VQATPSLAPRSRTSASPAGVAQALYAASFTLHQRITRDLYQLLNELGLSVTQAKMLHLLQQQPDEELSVKALGEHFRLSLAAASRAVEELHQRGYAERRECPEDRRIKRVRITDGGRAAIAELHVANIAAVTAFATTLTTTERRDLVAALAPLLERLEVRPTPEGPAA
jgi:DNA-binding MarR family transcriptional regulator